MIVEIAFAFPVAQGVFEIEVAASATVDDALAVARNLGYLDKIELGAVGIFGEPVAGSRVLVSGDRVELYRPLSTDPKQARRLRAATKSRP